MPTEENKEVVRRVIEEGTNGKNLAVFDELLSPSFVDHEAGSQSGGSEGEKKLLTSVTEAFPDWRWDIQEMLAIAGETVDARRPSMKRSSRRPRSYCETKKRR